MKEIKLTQEKIEYLVILMEREISRMQDNNVYFEGGYIDGIYKYLLDKLDKKEI